MNIYTAITKEVDGWWIGWIKEIDGVNCQEKTHSELIISLKETLSELIEMNKEESTKSVKIEDYNEELISV